jgi:hypothetical protein
MVIPQVPDQVKRAPTLALRAVFAGIGRILMAADRPQATATASAACPDSGDEHGPEAGRRRPQAFPAAAAVPGSRWRSLDQTGNVRLLSAEDLDDRAVPAASERATSEAATRETATRETATRETAAGRPAEGGPAGGGPAASGPAASAPALPLANYDELSLASIRARLRSLDAGQLRVLTDYERRNAERPDVLGMLERRIGKLEAGE